jgi:hypothetical protein
MRAALPAILLSAALVTGCGEAEATKCKTRSGFPVPRFVSLKSGEVNARKGPGEDHRILWVWRVKNMPLMVVAESRDWRKVRAPNGDEAWVKAQMVDGGSSVMWPSSASTRTAGTSCGPAARRAGPPPMRSGAAARRPTARASGFRQVEARVEAAGAPCYAPPPNQGCKEPPSDRRD